MKKKKIIFILTGVLLTSAVFIGMLAFAAEYGTQNDPLVSLSYINSIFAPEIKGQISEEVSKQINSAKTEVDSKVSSYTTVVDGKIVYDNGEFPTIDIEKVCEKVEASRQRILSEI